MLAVIGITIVFFMLYVLTLQINVYNKLVFNRYRYKYFALRDRLALLVMQGHLEEDSWEYQNILKVLNYHISAVETFSVKELFLFYNADQTNKTVKKIKRSITNEKVRVIMFDYFEVTSKLLYKNSRAQIFVIKKVAKFFAKSPASNKIPQDTQSAIKSPKNAFDKVEQFKDMFTATQSAT